MIKAIALSDETADALERTEPTHLYFRIDSGLVKVPVANILFIEGMDNYLKIHLYDGQPLVVRLTLTAMLEKLPAKKFIRVHRSYIVAIDKIQATRSKMIVIGEKEIPIASSYEKAFFKLFIR